MSESRSVATIKAFKNSELGEAWVEEGEAPDWQRLLERRDSIHRLTALIEAKAAAPQGAPAR